MKGNNKEVKISYWAAHATTIVSVTLVLLLIGIIAIITTAASGETRRIRERIELAAILTDSVSDNSATTTLKTLQALPYVKSATLISRADAMRQWQNETGENLEELFGVNPLSPEIDFSLHADYANPDSIKVLEKRIAALPDVAEVASPDAEMVEKMNYNISTLSLILGAITLVMLVISFVLINNTVHLTVYSRRFTIHTMQLVGATNAFIKRPFVLHNMIAGSLAGVVAAAIIAIAIAVAPKTDFMDPAKFISWNLYAIIAVGLIIIGALICSLAAAIATTRFLRKDYGELFK